MLAALGSTAGRDIHISARALARSASKMGAPMLSSSGTSWKEAAARNAASTIINAYISGI